MKRASQIINDIQNNKADSLFLDIYQDESMIEFQKKRYVDAIEQYINLYKDEEVEIFSVPGRSEVCGNHTDHQHGQGGAEACEAGEGGSAFSTTRRSFATTRHRPSSSATARRRSIA